MAGWRLAARIHRRDGDSGRRWPVVVTDSNGGSGGRRRASHRRGGDSGRRRRRVVIVVVVRVWETRSGVTGALWKAGHIGEQLKRLASADLAGNRWEIWG